MSDNKMTAEQALERDIARMEAEMAHSVSEYFKHRPQLFRTIEKDRIYEAGFKSAWNARADAAQHTQQVIADLRAEVEALRLSLDGLLKASEALRVDMLCRAKKDSDGIAVVDASHSKWEAFKKAIIDAARLREGDPS